MIKPAQVHLELLQPCDAIRIALWRWSQITSGHTEAMLTVSCKYFGNLDSRLMAEIKTCVLGLLCSSPHKWLIYLFSHCVRFPQGSVQGYTRSSFNYICINSLKLNFYSVGNVVLTKTFLVPVAQLEEQSWSYKALGKNLLAKNIFPVVNNLGLDLNYG